MSHTEKASCTTLVVSVLVLAESRAVGDSGHDPSRAAENLSWSSAFQNLPKIPRARLYMRHVYVYLWPAAVMSDLWG